MVYKYFLILIQLEQGCSLIWMVQVGPPQVCVCARHLPVFKSMSVESPWIMWGHLYYYYCYCYLEYLYAAFVSHFVGIVYSCAHDFAYPSG